MLSYYTQLNSIWSQTKVLKKMVLILDDDKSALDFPPTINSNLNRIYILALWILAVPSVIICQLAV